MAEGPKENGESLRGYCSSGGLGLVVFGPKKLAELGQHVGRALAAFRKATDEFNRNWDMKSLGRRRIQDV